MKRRRLDVLLVERGLVQSRSRARDLVLRGAVMVDGCAAEKPGQLESAEVVLSVDSGANRHVARSAEKLIAALDEFGFPAEGRTVLDVGASTGGFTEALLNRGAQRVYAVDVGSNQLAAKLAGDDRVVSLENTDARALTASHVPEAVDAIAVDVSFIPLAKVIAPVSKLAGAGAWLVALVKPQFEVGRDSVGKGGIVRDEVAAQLAIDEVAANIEVEGWRVTGRMVSPLAGKKGNVEHLIGAVRHG